LKFAAVDLLKLFSWKHYKWWADEVEADGGESFDVLDGITGESEGYVRHSIRVYGCWWFVTPTFQVISFLY
jgi:hypothetical protein